MKESPIPEIFVEELIRQVKAEANRHKRTETDDEEPFQAIDYPEPAYLASMSPALGSDDDSERFAKEESYHIDDFLKFHDSHFLENAYLALLGRRPDRNGGKFYLESLRSGKMSKAEILGRIRYSPEGKAKAVKVRGLMLLSLVQNSYRIPVLGYLIRMAAAIVKTPAIVRNIQQLDAHFHYNLEGIQNGMRELHRSQLSIENAVAAKAEGASFELMVEQFHSVTADLSAKLSSLDSLCNDAVSQVVFREVSREVSQEAEKSAAMQNRIDEMSQQIRDHQRNILDQQRRITYLLEEVRRSMPEPLGSDQMAALLEEQDHLLDAYYVSFEDQFRGTRKYIKKRQQVYLPYIAKMTGNGMNASILDVGCGRGEWLELLKESGYTALGIDRNRIMIRECRERGLEVVEEDVMEFLRKQPASSFSAVTGYHIVEHLPLQVLINLLDESLRVLKPGGMIIFETPNPENILVGSGSFYIDPTHKNPLYPTSLQFMAEQRGYVQVEILRLNKIKDPTYSGQECVDELIRRANMEQDYALIGYRA